MAPQAGQLIGAYEVVAPLGSGGMGELYRARDLRLGRMVAIKFIASALHGRTDAESRLDREARLASSLNHPGIVTVYDVGVHEGQPYVVMELIDGRPLSERLAEGRLPVREAVEIALQVGDALAAAHDAGVIHRDLKPQNIMLTSSGRAKIVDFGLSKIADRPDGSHAETVPGDTLTAGHAVLGTVGYMAPEQVMAVAVDGRADQFALGCILYEMLTGRRAFRRETAVQTMTSILEDDPVPVASLRPEVPLTVAAILSRCLAKRPDQRYASTRDLAHDARDAYEQILLDTRSATHALPPVRPSWRWVLPAAALAVVLVGVATWPRPPQPETTARQGPAGLRYLCVLPFSNITKDPVDQVFADGLMETLTSSLTQIERYPNTLRVVPASEIRSQRIESAGDARQAFGVTLVISGSIQRLASGARVTMNLIDPVAVVQLASRSIDVAVGQSMMTQDAIAVAVLALLSLEGEPGARDALTAGGTSQPEAYEAYVQGRGYLYRFDRGPENVDRAIDALNRAVALDAKYALAHTALGEAYWRKYELTRDTALIDRAKAHCEQALAIDSRLAAVHVTLAMLARGRGRYEEALAVAQSAIDLDPTNGDAYRELARTHELLGRYDDAEATYRKALAARPDDWQGYNSLGGFYVGRGRWADAEAAYQAVIKLTPDNTRGYNNLGVTYFRMKRPDDAARTWEQSIAIRPTFSATSNLGTLYYGGGRYTEAARAFERAVELQPNDVRLWRNLAATLYWAPGEREKSRAAYEKAVELGEADRKVNPRQPQLLAQLADGYAMLGRRPEALAAAAAVERQGEVDGDVAFMLGSVYEHLGDRTAAFAWLRRAIEGKYPVETIARSPFLAELRKDARYSTLVNPSVNP
jgi:serine/threonine protein kinase/tetratricopeptide (TPR) repeat protein